MKAKDYFLKYHELVMLDAEEAGEKLIAELSEEAEAIREGRNIRRHLAFMAVLNAQNQKWNAVCYMLQQKYGRTKLKRNVFIEFWTKKLMEEKRNGKESLGKSCQLPQYADR